MLQSYQHPQQTKSSGVWCSAHLFFPASVQQSVREARSLLGNTAAIVVNNSSYLIARKHCIYLEMGLSQRVVTKVARPIAHGKKRGLAGGTLLPGFSLRPQFILPGNAEAVL